MVLAPPLTIPILEGFEKSPCGATVPLCPAANMSLLLNFSVPVASCFVELFFYQRFHGRGISSNLSNIFRPQCFHHLLNMVEVPDVGNFPQ